MPQSSAGQIIIDPTPREVCRETALILNFYFELPCKRMCSILARFADLHLPPDMYSVSSDQNGRMKGGVH